MKFRRFIRFNNYQIQMIILGTILIVVIVLFINNHRSIEKLERQQEKLDSINKALDLKEAIHQKRLKEFEEQAEKNRKQVETLKKDIEKQLEE
ncbi:DUF4446 family protein [Flavobacterium johnsoniae]|uniref:DUF4446 family protein n=1 Tax=Flavobacterium johnsoniae TaxID=986 RepID=UPI0011EBC099|nr:DUF4446 family protein [Flavobacterium johnsoniae]